MKYLKEYKLFESSLLNLSDNVDDHLISIIKKNFKPGSKILEISCGNGADAKHLKDLGYDIICTEIDDNYVRNAKNLGLKCIKHDTRNNFPFEDKQFDLIYAKLSLHYFTKDELNKIFKELRRISHNILFTVKVQDDDFKTGKIIIPPHHWIGITSNNYGSEKSFYIKEGDLYGKPAKWVEIFAEAKPYGPFKDLILDLNDIFMDLIDLDLCKSQVYYLGEWENYSIKSDEIFINSKLINERNITGLDFEMKIKPEYIEDIKYSLKRAKSYFDNLKSDILELQILKDISFYNKKKIDIDEIDESMSGVVITLNIYEKEED
jgi:SAM-dependent methyltransferase